MLVTQSTVIEVDLRAGFNINKLKAKLNINNWDQQILTLAVENQLEDNYQHNEFALCAGRIQSCLYLLQLKDDWSLSSITPPVAHPTKQFPKDFSSSPTIFLAPQSPKRFCLLNEFKSTPQWKTFLSLPLVVFASAENSGVSVRRARNEKPGKYFYSTIDDSVDDDQSRLLWMFFNAGHEMLCSTKLYKEQSWILTENLTTWLLLEALNHVKAFKTRSPSMVMWTMNKKFAESSKDCIKSRKM